jgi:ornithine cyclodeaminase/alanine dehydrogenase-like protein (mu-crystallin family)
MKPPGTLLLQRSQVAELLSLDECIAAVEEAFRLQGEGKLASHGALSTHFPGGGFHIKTAMNATRAYYAAKLNGNFPANPERCGLPTIQGLIALCDAANGSPLAVMDSIEITILRTGAATAVAARRMARANSTVATICGCGNQGRVQLRAIARVLPSARAYAFDLNPGAAAGFAREMAAELGIEVNADSDINAALGASDVCVTCTPSQRFFIHREAVRPGTFIAAVGADNPYKQELQPELLAGARVVADDAMQCASMGELHHAIEKGLMTAEECADLAEVVAGRKPGRGRGDHHFRQHRRGAGGRGGGGDRVRKGDAQRYRKQH